MTTVMKQTARLQGVSGVLAAMLMVLSPVLGWAGSNKIAGDLDTTKSTRADVIVMYTDGPSDTHVSKAVNRGAAIHQHLHLVKGTAMSMPANQIQKLLADDPNITFVAPDRVVHSHGESFTPNFVAVNADMAQSAGYNGSNIYVNVLDSGIDASQPDLSSQIIYSQDFTGEGTTNDLYGHGTHVAGIIAGNASQSTCSSCTVEYVGIAPSVNLVNMRVLDHTGAGKDSNVIAAIQQVISWQQQNPGTRHVINLSLGRGVYTSYKNDPLDQAVEAAWKAGIVVVVAAGNYGRDNSAGERDMAPSPCRAMILT